MGKFNKEMVKARRWRAKGSSPLPKARDYFKGDKRTVVDGPFTESGEPIAALTPELRERELCLRAESARRASH